MIKIGYVDPEAHPAGDGSLRRKKSKIFFFKFRLNLLIKISYIPNFKKMSKGFKSYGQ